MHGTVWTVTWPIFAVLQLALTLVGAIVVFCLHHRRLSKENDALREACEAVAANAGGADSSEALKAQLEAVTGDDPAAQVQKLVLATALETDPNSQAKVAALPANPQIQSTWHSLRSTAWQQACDAPDLRPAFEQYAALDTLLDFASQAWPEADAEPAEESDTLSADEVDAMFGAQEETAEPEPAADALDAEALLEENKALKEELAALKGNGSDADLRKLLKQFTQDSREMMGCIQELEKENQALKEQLGQTEAA